jgi:hypothetical protein
VANLNFTYVPEQDFSRGIDQYSAEAQIQPGFVEDALNVDIKERRLVKRPGYQAFAGSVPMRVESLEYEVPSVTYPTGRAYIQLNNTLDLSVIRDVPIVVYGRTALSFSGYGGDFDTADSGQYYYVINTDPRKTLSGASTLVDDHGFTNTNFLVGVVESTSPLNYDNSVVKMNYYTIDKSSYDLTLYHTLTSNLSAFVYYKSLDTVAGLNYVDTTAPISPFAPTQHTHLITAGTHGLNNFNILASVFVDIGTTWEKIEVDQTKIYANGNVEVTYTMNVAVTDIKVILTSLPTANVQEATFFGTGLQTFTLSAQTQPFIFYALYAKDPDPNGVDLVSVEPQSVTYDTALQQYTFTVDVGVSTGFVLYYDFGQIQTNVLTVEPAVAITSAGTDNSPQMTLWGIPHSFTGIYGTYKLAREGWVTHLDSYRSPSSKHVVCGLGGNLFSALPRTELSGEYKLPSLLLNLRNRVDADTKVGPLFRATGETFARTRGYVNFTGGAAGWATVTAIAYQTSGPNVGQVRYTLNVPSYSASPNLAGAFSTTANLEDWLTVQQTGYSLHQGEFKIKAVSGVDADNIYVYVENTAVDSADFDETDVGGLAGVFTDQLVLDTENYFIPSDKLLADIFSESLEFVVKSGTATAIVFTGATDTLSVPTGLRVRGQRTSDVIPLRTPEEVASVEDFVIGDVLAYPYIDRLLEVHSVVAKGDVAVTITGDGEEATITVGSGDTNFLPVGQKFTLVHAGPYTGVHEVKDVLSLSQLVVAHTSTEAVSSGEIQGFCLHVDEEFQWYDDSADTTSLTVERRWIPVEAPDDTYAVTPGYRVRHLDSGSYTDQAFLRSTMVADNMYLTNGQDEVLKYDGTSIYRAGLFRWQPSLFLSVQSSGSIIVPSISISGTTSGSTFSVTTAGEEESLNIGDKVKMGGNEYTIIRINTTTNDIIVNEPITGSPTTIELASSTYRYYYRLNAIDANNNIVASAVTGHEDARVTLTGSSNIQHKLVGFPTWDNYDYDRIELEIYRTKLGTQAPFYKIVTLPVDFNTNGGYLTYLDTTEDAVLNQLDPVNSALLGSEIGTGWEEPMRAKYLTTANNSLVLANLRDYPQLDLVIDGASATVASCNGLKWSLERDYNTVAPTVTDNSGKLIFETRNTGDDLCSVTTVTTTTFDIDVSAGTTPTLVAGDWVYLFHKGSVSNPGLEACGWWQIDSVQGVDLYRIKHPSSGSFSGTAPNSILVATNTKNIPVYVNNATSTNWDSNYLSNGQPVSGPDEKNVVMNRLANAINCVQTKLSRTVGFTPWIVANSDGSYGNGQLVLRQPRADSRPFYLRLPSTTAFQMYTNGLIARDSNGALILHIQAATRVYPSRVLVSYPNYPEMFDYPTAILPQDSDSVIDVNPADGQEITGVIPFFGDSAFGGATKGSVVVCFKQQSIYLLDLGAKSRGDNTNTVQKLESHGLGCTAPYSIAVTKDGVLFANEAGIYRLNRDLSVEYIGKYMERQWTENTLRSSEMLALMQGHHYAIGKMYKLSVPTNSELDYPDQVYAYHHSSETGQNGQGGWTRYDSHNSIGWCNLESDAYFCDTDGRVRSIRRLGDETDFRDAGAPIEAVITCRGMDFGAPGIRKVFGAIMTHYRANLAQIDGTVLTYAYDLQEEFRVTDPLRISRVSELTGVSDGVNSKGKTIKSVLDRKRAVYFQVRFTNGNIDEPMDIAGFTVKVAGLTDGGVLEAAKTTR